MSMNIVHAIVLIIIGLSPYAICAPSGVVTPPANPTAGPTKIELLANVAVDAQGVVQKTVDFVRPGKGLFLPQPPSLEHALLESESPISAKMSLVEQLQYMLTSFLQPQPIIDNIREEDKYGNTGDRFITVSRAVVGGVEGLTNLINKVVDYPFEAFKKITRGATEKLNNFGGRLVGL